MGDPRHLLGLAAEAAVARWLAARGWTIIGRRCRAPGRGELDIVTIDPGGVLVGVEVRARRHGRTGRASASVDARRVARLRRTLAAVAAEMPGRHTGLRIDLVTAEPCEAPDDPRWHLRRLPGIG